MKTQSKLSSEARRAAIIKAVRTVFAEKGFHGTTTRELADAAGVSEALLFKHFPTKEALYSAMQVSCCAEQNGGTAERLKALEPSTSTLVLIVHRIVSHLVEGPPQGSDEAVQHRLMLQSMMEDGDFARLFLQRIASRWIPKIKECIQASIAAGDAAAGPVTPHLGAWFTQHLAALLMTYLHPEPPIVDYGVSRQELIEQAVWFSLRGIGVKDEVIKRHYNPEALALLAS
jgi:AcrR family transcriptional regulator